MQAGVSINLVVTREPDRICWSDACPFGLGGYSISGHAWRLQLPNGHPLRDHPRINNLLEFTAIVVNIWLKCIDSTVPHPCILVIEDSTSAIGWLFKSSTLDSSPGAGHAAHFFVARKLATILIGHAACIASQHIKGEQNLVADLFSFSGTSELGKPHHPLAHDNPPNDFLTQRFRDEFTEQVPEDFVISQLPNVTVLTKERTTKSRMPFLNKNMPRPTRHARSLTTFAHAAQPGTRTASFKLPWMHRSMPSLIMHRDSFCGRIGTD